MQPLNHNHVESNDALPRVPFGLNRSGVACWWSILRLIAERSPCHLWTLTTAETMPDSYYGNMHAQLLLGLAHDVRDGRFPAFGGVRVIEPHPGGHGLHYHWVVGGRIPIDRFRQRTTAAGFGRIHVVPEPVTPAMAGYLAKYLNKANKLHGVRRWACIGNYEGVKCADLEAASTGAETFRQCYREAIATGSTKTVAWNYAKMRQQAIEATLMGWSDPGEQESPQE